MSAVTARSVSALETAVARSVVGMENCGCALGSDGTQLGGPAKPRGQLGSGASCPDFAGNTLTRAFLVTKMYRLQLNTDEGERAPPF